MLTLRHSDYEKPPIMLRMYPPLLKPNGGIFVKAKLILPRHLHDVNSYPSTVNLNPEQQHDKSNLPYNGGFSNLPCVTPKVN